MKTTHATVSEAVSACGPTDYVVNTAAGFVVCDGIAAAVKAAVEGNPAPHGRSHRDENLAALEADIWAYEGDGPAVATFGPGGWSVDAAA